MMLIEKFMEYVHRIQESRISVAIVVCMALFTDILAYGMVVPIFTEEVLDFNLTKIGLLYAGYAFGVLAATPVFGIASDKFGRKWPMIIGLFALGTSTLMLAFVRDFYVMFIARLFQGIAAASTWVGGLALIADYYPSGELGPVMGAVMAVEAMGTLLGPPFGGIIYEYGGYQLPFLIAAGMAVVDGLIRFLLISDRLTSAERSYMDDLDAIVTESFRDKDEETEALKPSPDVPVEKATFITLLKNKNILILCVVLVLGTNGLSILEPSLPAHLNDTFDGISAIMVGLIFMADSVGYGIASPIVGYIGDKWHGRKPLLVVGMICVSVVLPLLALPRDLWLQFVLSPLCGAALAILLNPILPSLAAVVDQMGGGAYGQVYAIYNFFYSLGMLGGPLLGGLIVENLGFFWGMVTFGASVLIFVPFVAFFSIDFFSLATNCGLLFTHCRRFSYESLTK